MRQNIIMKHRRSQNEMRSIRDEQNGEHLFPKLKSHSHNGHSSLSFVKLKCSMRSRLLCQDSSRNYHYQRSLSQRKEQNDRPVMIKYQYVNMSPSYFKKLSKKKQSGNDQYNHIRRDSKIISSEDKRLIKPELVDLIQSRVNNNVMKDSAGNCSKNNNAQEKSQIIPTSKKESFVIQKQNPKNSLTKSKAQYDKIRAFILLEKYGKNIEDESKELHIPTSKENEQKRQTSLSPLQYSTSSLYETKYSSFEANSLLPLKSQLKTPKINFSQKLNLYRFQ